MTVSFFFKGIVAGSLVAVPVGPIGILCLRRMLIQGPAIGLSSGLGSAVADIIYAALAMMGLSFISTFLLHHFVLLRLISSFFLAVVGLVIYYAKPPRPRVAWTQGIIEAFFSTFFLTLTNPLLIISFIACFSILHVNYTNYVTADLLALIIGVFIGSNLWWIILAAITSWFNISIKPHILTNINKISGVAIIISAVITLLSIIIS